WLSVPFSSSSSSSNFPANYMTVISQAVTVDAGKTGQYELGFLASASGGSHARVAYAIDSVYDPDASTNIGDALPRVGALGGGGWQELALDKVITLSPGTHIVSVGVWNDGGTMTIANAYLHLVGYNKIGGVAAADVVSAEAYNQGNWLSVPFS